MRTTTLLVGTALLLAGCGDAEPDGGEAEPAATETTQDESATTAAEGAVEITGVNYAYEGAPDTVEVGTELSFVNGAEEPHELVLVRLHDDAPSVEEFLKLPREEGEKVSTFKGVSMAMPQEPGRVLDGELVADEPGNYLMFCALPIGVTAEFIQENPEGPPPTVPEEFGPPHFTEGMFATFTVE